ESSTPDAAFISRYNDNANKTTGSSYTVSVGLNTAHADRVVIIGVESSLLLDATTATLGGVAMTPGPVLSALQLFYLPTGGTAIENDTTANFVITNNSGSTASRIELGAWACYPSSSTP